ncbi:helix-turn-helix domain-containing protein [Pseudomonas sp. NA-150]|uniref:helix-turn-helix domain-containing protein n=1 Tax=Pseudomonas sp. NA-150 TaxID=3367525 RepID=UPI0037C8BAC2
MNSLTRTVPTSLDSVAYQLIEALSSALADPRVAERELVYQRSLALCSHLLSRYERDDLPKVHERIALSPWQERMAKDIMTRQMSKGLSIARIASDCSLSRSHFSRAFKKSTGYSPRDWFLQMRIGRAKALLLEGRVSISQISLDCGFADQSHFTRVFTRVAGATPFTWRRSQGAEKAALN